MHVAYSLIGRLTDQPTVLTMGRFDGVHLGHQFLIRTAVDHARGMGFASAVLTWEPHPNVVIRPDQELVLLSNLEERVAQIGVLNPDFIVVAPFNRETMTTPAVDYMAQICHALPVRELWVGADFAMGYKREGDIPRLIEIGRDLGFAVGTVSRRQAEHESISSSRIRQTLRDGDVETAAMLLGRPFSLSGVVAEGDKRGRTIGFPTVNVVVAPVRVLPGDGVYACRVTLPDSDTALPAVTNVGMRPTFDGVRRTVEAHLLDWSGDLYGKTVQVAFLHRLRGERKFNGIDELVAQIERDAQQARELLR